MFRLFLGRVSCHKLLSFLQVLTTTKVKDSETTEWSGVGWGQVREKFCGP